MKLTAMPEMANTRKSFQRCESKARTFFKVGCLFSCFLLGGLFSSAQSVAPSTLNVCGQWVNTGNYQFEWNVGESASIITMTNPKLVVTTGVLQSIVANAPFPNNAINWLVGEIKIYPVPTLDIIEINILHNKPGRTKLELFDLMGKKVMEKEFEYYGLGLIEHWDLSRLPSGEYFLNIQQVNPVSGKVMKKGTFKIQKIK